MDGYSRRSNFGRHNRQRFDISYIIGDPFALSTISIAVIGWIIALGGSIAVDAAGKFPTLTWWGIVFEFLVILGIIYVVGAQAIHPYRIALVGFLATATVYTTNSTNNFVWTGTPASGAVAAGHILLSIINILWVFYFGTTEDARLHSFVDSFAIHNGGAGMHQQAYSTGAGGGMSRGDSLSRRSNPFMNESIGMNYRTNNNNNNTHPGGGKLEVSSTNDNSSQQQQQQMFTSDQLGAFEHSTHDGGDSQSGIQSTTNTEVLTVPTVYPYKAVALYSYQASPDDANEISFDKGEVLEIADTSGRWWQARRQNGEVGICPSNYVQLEN